MASKDIDIKLKLDAKQADKDLKGIKEDLEDLDETTTVKVDADTESAEGDIKEVSQLSDRLASNPTVVDILADIDKAKANIDEFKADLRSVDDASTTTGKKLGDDMEHGTDRAKDATHSLAGAAIGDSLGAATGFGALGEAISQVTEGALGGEVALKSMLTAGLGLGAITLVVTSIQKGLEINKNIDAFNKKKVDDFVTALRAGKTALEQLNDEFADTGKVEFIDVADGKTKDLVGTLADAGITLDEFTGKVALGKEGFKQWVIANGEAIAAHGDLNAVIQAGNQYIDDSIEANKAWNDQQFVSGATSHETERELHRLNNTYDVGTNSVKDNTEATRKGTIQVDKFKEQTALADGAYRHLIDALDEQQAWADVNQAVSDYNANTKHSDEDTRNLIRTVADYVNATDTIPESKKTEIFADLNSGDVTKIEADLEELTRQRDIKILLTAVGSQDIIQKLGQKGVKTMAGGPVMAGHAYTVNDGTGPETFVPSVNGKIVPHGQPVDSGGIIGSPVTIIQYFPPGISPLAVAAANKQYHRRGGR